MSWLRYTKPHHSDVCVVDICFIMQWTANATNDMLADAVLTVILQVDTSPASKAYHYRSLQGGKLSRCVELNSISLENFHG